jgi:hypothetical protein
LTTCPALSRVTAIKELAMTHACHFSIGRRGKEPTATVWRRWRLTLTALLAALVAVLLPPSRAAAQGALQLRLSSDAEGENEVKSPVQLRPNNLLPLFLHVTNTGPATEVTVEMVDGDRKSVKTPPFQARGAKDAGGRTSFSFGKPPEKDAKPAPLVPGKAPLTLRLFPKGSDMPAHEVTIDVARPNLYAKVKEITFASDEEDTGRKNVLTVVVEALDTFAGDPARVDLVLDPERIPSLKPGQEKVGRYSGLFSKGRPLTLRAENLEFLPDKRQEWGLIYLTVDGYPRAFTYASDFPISKTAARPTALLGNLVRLVHPAVAKPGPKYPVTVEVDNSQTGSECVLGMYGLLKELDGMKKVEELEGQAVKFAGDRQKTILHDVAGPKGTLLLQGKVADWAPVLDTTDVFGKRWLALQMLKGNEVVEVQNTKEVRKGDLDKKEPQIIEEVLLYEGRPTVSTLDVDLKQPYQLVIGAPLPVKAEIKDKSGVTRAVFFTGKLPPDGKIPPTAVQAEGMPSATTKREEPVTFRALLPIPTEKRATVLVSVQVTNNVNQTAIKTIEVQLIDPKGAGAAEPKFKGATIKGKVVEGAQAVPGVPVSLSDEKGAIKAVTRTDEKGMYRFERVPVGAYAVNAVRSASRTRGRTLVSVPEGKELIENVDVKITR